MPTKKKKNRRLLRVERLETRTVPSPIHGLEVQALHSLTPDLVSTPGGQAELAQNQDAPPVADAPGSAEADHGNHNGNNTLAESDSHSYSEDNGATGVTPVLQQNSGDQSEESVHPEGDNSDSQPIMDSSEAQHNNHGGNTVTETENHSNSDGNPGSTQTSGDQNGESSDAKANNATAHTNSAPSDQNHSSTSSVNGSEDHSANKNNSANDSDPAKTTDKLPAQKGSGDDSNHSSESTGNGVTSTSSGDQGNSVQPTGRTADADEGASDGGSHANTSDRKDVSSKSSSSSTGSDHQVSNSAADTQSAAASDGVANHSALRTDLDSLSAKNSPIALSSGTSGILMDAAPLAASLAPLALQTGTDSLLADVPRFADTADQMLHSGLEVLETTIGMGEMTAIENLPVAAYDLLLGFLPVDQESLDQAMQGFLSRVENLGEQLTGSETGAWIYPVVLTILVATHVASRRWRRSAKQQIWTVDRGSWMGNWFPSLSTLQK